MRTLLPTLASLALASASHAQVVNGDFETGDLTGWTQFGNTAYTGVSSTAAHAGNFGAYFGPITSTGGISQVLALNVGDQVTVSFWLKDLGGTPNSFQATFDGQPLLSFSNDTGFDYTQFSSNVTVSNSSPTLQFEFEQTPSYWYLDDVSVSRTPAPATSLVGLGLAALRRRRR